MAYELGDILQFTAKQTFLGQEILNVYHFRIDEFDPANTYEDFADQFETGWYTEVGPIISTGLDLTGVEIKNLTNGIDIWEHAGVHSGQAVGNTMPSFVTYSYRMNRASGLTRHGYKRFAGVTESVTDGNNIATGNDSIINAAAAWLAEGVKQSGTAEDFTLAPVIIGRTLGANGKYELDLDKVNDVASVQFVRVSTQNTRKAGRGN